MCLKAKTGTLAFPTGRIYMFMRWNALKGRGRVRPQSPGTAMNVFWRIRRRPTEQEETMKTEDLRIGMKVAHPEYGTGAVKAITERTADVRFDGGLRTISPEASRLEPAEAYVVVDHLEIPLTQLIEQAAAVVAAEFERRKSVADEVVGELGSRWHGGRLVLHPADASLQAKEVPLEVFFHKIVMMRNNLRVLEQKVNGHEKLTDGEKVEMEQYISRCYGSMTTFNILFANTEGQFASKR
jgi:hypothetical protein